MVDSVHHEDRIDVQVATRLEGPLLEAAAEALGRAEAAQAIGDLGTQTRNSVLVILAAEAALEAFLNAEAEARTPAWWPLHDRDPLAEKWPGLVEELTGVRPACDASIVQRIVRLETEQRNLVAHFKGVPNFTRGQFRGKKLERMQPPVQAAGNISATRAFFHAAAPEALNSVRDAVKEFYAAVGEDLPDGLAISLAWPTSP